MNRPFSRVILIAICWLIPCRHAAAVELVIPSKVSTALNRALARNYNTYAVNTTEAARIHSAFLNWTTKTISYDTATRHQSLRFGGAVSYYQQLRKNVAIYVYKKLEQQPLPSKDPIPVICRFAPDRYGFRKQLDVEAQQPVNDAYAVEIVGAFLTNGNFLATSDIDKHEASFYQIREKHAPHADRPERDILLAQQVNFRRKFLNAPVINSKISVNFHPDNLEILGFKHYNWTPVDEDTPVPVPSSEMKERTDVQEALSEQITAFWSDTQTATLTGVEQMWFQTRTGLIPILMCTIERPSTPTRCGDICQTLINLAGGEYVFAVTPVQIPHFPVCLCDPPVTGDFNHDCHVNFKDFGVLGDAWKKVFNWPHLCDVANNWLR